MYTLQIDRNSWHYRLQQNFDLTPHNRTDTCSYLRGVVGALLICLMLAVLTAVVVTWFVVAPILAIVMQFTYGTIPHPTPDNYPWWASGGLQRTGFVVWTFYGIVACVWAFNKLRRSKVFDVEAPTPSSPLVEAASMWANKTCGKIEFTGEREWS